VKIANWVEDDDLHLFNRAAGPTAVRRAFTILMQTDGYKARPGLMSDEGNDRRGVLG
jgi:hypothetical protein